MISISAVIPLFRVEKYLPDLLTSLSAQRPGGYTLEVLFVDDGSPDRSGAIAQRWLRDSGMAGCVIQQQNTGVSAARNRGLQAATGEWVTFPDSDDFVSPDYFCNVARFIARHGSEVAVVSTRLVRLTEPETVTRDVHALKFRFMAGNRRVSMSTYPDFFQLNVASAFFRTDEIMERGLRFREGLHASEDALFVAELLLGRAGDPVLGLVADARYVYRRRAARDSAIDQFRNRADTYIERFADGYLPLMEAAAARGGVPEWLQSMFLYECQWILPVQLTEDGYAGVLDDAARARTLEVLTACARHITEGRLFAYDATALPLESRLLLQLMAGRDIPRWVPVFRDRQGTVLTYVSDPEGIVAYDGVGVAMAVASRVETPDYFNQQLLHRWVATAPSAHTIAADGVVRAVADRVAHDTSAQQQDRSRRRAYGQIRRAIPARENEVRVWKPVPGPLGSPWARMRWDLSIVKRRVSRLLTVLRSR